MPLRLMRRCQPAQRFGRLCAPARKIECKPGQISILDLRRRGGGKAAHFCFAPEPVADARSCAARTSAPLVGIGDRHTELVQLAAQGWQTQVTPVDFVNVQKAAMICLSSLVPAEDVQAMLKKVPEHVPVVVVKLSTAIPSPFGFAWRDVLFKPEEQPVDRLRQSWWLSSLRRKVMKNEEAIDNILRTRANAWLTDTLDLPA